MTVAATVVQLLLPQQVMGNYAIALVLVMFLIIIQNPDDFTDKAADCFNDEAFSTVWKSALTKVSLLPSQRFGSTG